MKLPENDDPCTSTGEELSMNARPWLTKKTQIIKLRVTKSTPQLGSAFGLPAPRLGLYPITVS